MNIADIQKKFVGYEKKLFDFVCLQCPGWAIDEVIEMAENKKTEAEIIEKCFYQMGEGVFDDESDADEYQEKNITEARKKYLKHCNPDGSFRYDDFLI